MSHLEVTLATQLTYAGLGGFVAQFRAIPGRQFAWDFSWPEQRLLVEVQGGTWNGGKHGRGSGILKDQEKLNLAQLAGWRVLQVGPSHIRDGQALRWIQEALKEVA